MIPRSYSRIALDIFDPDLNKAEVVAQIQKKKSGIKKVLLDQSVMSGVGNIYADEALWRAKIHPERMANLLKAGLVWLLLVQ